jgi:hypothetical protein
VTERYLPDKSPATLLFLVSAVLCGALLAAWLHFTATGKYLPEQTLASVRGVAIKKTDFLQLLQQVSSERRNPMTAADRKRLLERMIEERLLVARALELGLARSNPDSRNAIVSSMLAGLVTDASPGSPAAANEAATQYLEQLRAMASIRIREDNLARHVSHR